MSWLDRIQHDLIIITGEGSTFPDGQGRHKPNWINATREREYNIAEFEFIDIEGTLVSRNKARGMKYNLEIYFQGSECIDDAELFRIAADDPRAWKVSHPYYGTLTVQPISLHFDNTKHNVSKITAMVIETITEEFPKGSVDPFDKINFDKAFLDQKMIDSFGFGDPSLASNTNINQLTDNVKKIYKAGLPQIIDSINANDYYNKYNTALSAVLVLANNVSNGMTAIKDLINAPILFVGTVKIRTQGLINQFTALSNSILTLFNTSSPLFTKATKKDYETNGGTVVSALAVTTVTNMDYANRNDVIGTIENILDTYNQYLADLDSFQTDNGGEPDSYIPDADSLIGLSALINFTVSSLFVIGLNSKQERAIYCETDTNLIILAHRLYGLLPDDSTIETLRANNEMGLNELIQIKKGRRVIYYV